MASHRREGIRTEIASHELTPRFRLEASRAIDWKSSCTWPGAGSGPGRENGALTRTLSEEDSLDMLASGGFCGCDMMSRDFARGNLAVLIVARWQAGRDVRASDLVPREHPHFPNVRRKPGRHFWGPMQQAEGDVITVHWLWALLVDWYSPDSRSSKIEKQSGRNGAKSQDQGAVLAGVSQRRPGLYSIYSNISIKRRRSLHGSMLQWVLSKNGQ